jgi:hypothetical protein
MLAMTPPHPVPRLLQDLAEGKLDESELEALAIWLTAQGLTETPGQVLAYGLAAGSQAGAGAA